MALTDNMLAQLQVGFREDYLKLKQEGNSLEEIYEKLKWGLDYDISDNSFSSLFRLPSDDADKAHTVLNTFIAACPENNPIYNEYNEYNYSGKLKFDSKRPLNPNERPEQIVVWINSRERCYCSVYEDILLWSILLRPYPVAPSDSFISSDQNAKRWTLIFLILLIFSAAVALCYLLRELVDGLERLWHIEGIWQTLISLSTAAAVGMASGLLAFFFLSAPIAALAFANPVSMFVLAVVCLTIISAGLGWFVAKQLQKAFAPALYPDALDPEDPYRFRVTDQEAENLIEKGIDPTKVKCAIAALREELGKNVPSYFSRLVGRSMPSYFSNLYHKQEILTKIRKLRRGELEAVEVQIGLVTFKYDCLLDMPTRQEQMHLSGEVNYQNFPPTPSNSPVDASPENLRLPNVNLGYPDFTAPLSQGLSYPSSQNGYYQGMELNHPPSNPMGPAPFYPGQQIQYSQSGVIQPSPYGTATAQGFSTVLLPPANYIPTQQSYVEQRPSGSLPPMHAMTLQQNQNHGPQGSNEQQYPNSAIIPPSIPTWNMQPEGHSPHFFNSTPPRQDSPPVSGQYTPTGSGSPSG